MSAVTTGDLLTLAGERLAAAESGTDRVADVDAAVRDLHRIVTTLAGLAGDVLSRCGANRAFPRHMLPAWEHAASEVHQALQEAATSLTVNQRAEGPSPLHDAAGTLAALRDLLAAHDNLAGISPWAQAISSAPVTRAMTAEIAGWAATLAPWAHWLAYQAPERGSDLAACRLSLRVVHAAAQRARTAEPVTSDDRALLHAIPSATPPTRIPPADDEQVSDLCARIAMTAERLRAAATTACAGAAWSVSATARAWQHGATAAAIISDTAALAIRTQAPAATALSQARDAWRNLALAWLDISTETSLITTRANTEASDLVIRMGRLAFDNPRWLPTREHQDSPLRTHPAQVTVPEIIGAAHQAADALAVMAAANLTGVTAAACAGRLYIRTRALPDSFDVPRAYASMPPQYQAPLLAAHQAAITAAQSAAQHLADLALKTAAPSRPWPSPAKRPPCGGPVPRRPQPSSPPRTAPLTSRHRADRPHRSAGRAKTADGRTPHDSGVPSRVPRWLDSLRSMPLDSACSCNGFATDDHGPRARRKKTPAQQGFRV